MLYIIQQHSSCYMGASVLQARSLLHCGFVLHLITSDDSVSPVSTCLRVCRSFQWPAQQLVQYRLLWHACCMNWALAFGDLAETLKLRWSVPTLLRHFETWASHFVSQCATSQTMLKVSIPSRSQLAVGLLELLNADLQHGQQGDFLKDDLYCMCCSSSLQGSSRNERGRWSWTLLLWCSQA